ncbi:DNA polymerase beta superfamily protein [Ahniella affigens]|nr:nucleotidyltransferase domain-containing protein [Ahniella affigens]
MLTLSDLRTSARDQVLFECVAGSRAYGTATADSDTDLRGVFIQPADAFVDLSPPQDLVADERHNEVYFSLRRLLELLGQANPNVLELLYMPDDCVRMLHPVYRSLLAVRSAFITRQCIDTHVGYAFSQVKKAKGQHKWINQPQAEAPPRPESYCQVLLKERWWPTDGSPPARPVPLSNSALNLRECHAAGLEGAADWYRLYHIGPDATGVFQGEQVQTASISLAQERTQFVGLLQFNQRAFEQAKNDHKHYWIWRAERNEARWRQQERGELDFDAKNMMHTLRLLMSARAMINEGQPRVRFAGAELEELRAVRAGQLRYAEIMQRAESLRDDCEHRRDQADLPERVDPAMLKRLLIDLTHAWQYP